LELKAMGVERYKPDGTPNLFVLSNDDGSVTIKFEWQYKGASPRNYSVTFIKADLTDPAGYPERLKKVLARGIDIYYQRAAFRVPEHYGSFIDTVAGSVRKGGYLITDDHTFPAGYFNPDTILAHNDRYRYTKENGFVSYELSRWAGLAAKFAITNRDLKAGFESYGYGWLVRIRKKTEDNSPKTYGYRRYFTFYIAMLLRLGFVIGLVYYIFSNLSAHFIEESPWSEYLPFAIFYLGARQRRGLSPDRDSSFNWGRSKALEEEARGLPVERIDEALELLLEANRLNKERISTMIAIASIYSKKQAYEEVEIWCRRALRILKRQESSGGPPYSETIKKNKVFLYGMLAKSYGERQLFDDALKYIELILGLHPGDEIACGMRCEYLYRMGRYKEASAECERALSLFPNNQIFVTIRSK
ncbi:MAG TPA: tetratricopeptide repeat protein, partial [Candidatus Omnitrophota bacterium]|nr:tetratricopeptide repeat protein [Candidatus Omnitrophota bacterium]